MSEGGEQSALNWRVGDICVHPHFGHGKVMRVFGLGSKRVLAIKFGTLGQKIIDPEIQRIKRMYPVYVTVFDDIDEIDEFEVQLQSEPTQHNHKLKSANPTETWVSRWMASPIAYIFPKERREEWLGDLYEVHREMLEKNYPRWLVNCIDVAKIAVLLTSALQIKVMDWILPETKRLR
jgi:hypothetical protein